VCLNERHNVKIELRRLRDGVLRKRLNLGLGVWVSVVWVSVVWVSVVWVSVVWVSVVWVSVVWVSVVWVSVVCIYIRGVILS
jgi:hypothetical protein